LTSRPGQAGVARVERLYFLGDDIVVGVMTPCNPQRGEHERRDTDEEVTSPSGPGRSADVPATGSDDELLLRFWT